MAFLVVLREDRPFLRFRLDQDEVSVGRGNAVELYVPDARISRVHFIVRREESGFRLIDRSTNGTFVNGVRVRVVRLKDQDTIIMGGCQIRFERGELEDPATTVASTPEGGVVSYDALQERLLYSRPVLVIRDQEGAPTRVAIRRNDVRIGSSHENDVVVSEAASRHCQLLETSDGFVIRCLDPASSTLVDEQPVRTDRPIPYGSTIRIGRATLELRLEEGAEPVLPLATPCFESMVGTTPRMHTLFGQIDRFARHDAPLIILGETGTGKELVARALHKRGPRARGPFVAINCSAISPQLFESELFGHERGAFTGAVRARPGAIEAAHRGVLFLDEIGDLPLELQPKLLRVLETSSVTPVGSFQPRPVDVRVVAATHKDLGRMVEEGQFRADLFYRLFVLTLELPPLRERMEDLPALVRHMLESFAADGPPVSLTAAAMTRLRAHSWPGNVRELRHVLTRAFASCEHREINERELLFLEPSAGALRGGGAQKPGITVRLEEMEKQAIEQALRRYKGNRTDAAQALGIARSTLHLRMKKYGLEQVT